MTCTEVATALVLAFPRSSPTPRLPPLHHPPAQPCIEYDRHSEPSKHPSQSSKHRSQTAKRPSNLSAPMPSSASTNAAPSIAAPNTSASRHQVSSSVGPHARPSTAMSASSQPEQSVRSLIQRFIATSSSSMATDGFSSHIE